MKINPTLLFFFSLLLAFSALAQDSLVVTDAKFVIKEQQVSDITFTDTIHYEAAPVLLYGDTLFLIKTPLNKSSTAERAAKITKNLKKIARDFNIAMDTIYTMVLILWILCTMMI